jgi:hypothetical protein
MQQADRAARVRVAEVGHRPAGGQLVQQRSGAAGPAEGCHRLLELVGDASDRRDAVADQEGLRRVLGQVRQVGQRGGHPFVPDQQWWSRQLLIAGRPEGQAVRHLEPARRRVGLAQPAQRVTGADQAVGGRADGPGKQPRHPLAHHGGHGPVGDLALEQGEPFGKAVVVAERGGPLLLRQRSRRGRCLVETGPVSGHPATDGVGPAQVGQRLGDHGAVVGQPDRPVIGRGGGKDRQGVIEGLRSHRPSMATPGWGCPGWRPLRSGL